MRRYIFRRILHSIPLLLIISIICFSLMHLAPGGPTALFAQNPKIRAEDIQRIRRNFGLDQPVPIQYLKWLKSVMLGDWGYSFVTGQPVTKMILERVPATLELMIGAFILSIILGVAIGILSAVKQYSFFDYIATLGSFFGFSMPVFWFALMMIFIFAGLLRWLPSAGMYTIGMDFSLIDRIRHLIMPTIVLSLLYIASWSRYMRSSLLEELCKDYVRTAKAKGLSERVVVLKHAVRNSLIPVVTVVALQIPSLFTGAIITETIFAWPGMGRLFYDSVTRQDYTVLMGILMIASALIVLFNLIADILYAWLDPRIRYDSKG